MMPMSASFWMSAMFPESMKSFMALSFSLSARLNHQLTNSPTHQITNSPNHQLTNSPYLSCRVLHEIRRLARIAGLVHHQYGVHVTCSWRHFILELRGGDCRRGDRLQVAFAAAAQDDVAGEIAFGIRLPDERDGADAGDAL